MHLEHHFPNTPPTTRPSWPGVIAVILMSALGACGKSSHVGQPAPAAKVEPTATDHKALAELGRHIFFDQNLSASGKQSCASCHDPNRAYGPPNGLAVQLGGLRLDQQGGRAVPSLRYVLNRTPWWSKVYVESLAERLNDGDSPPTGGFGWDGRFNTLHQQAEFPLLAPNEMANASPADIVSKLARADYADQFRQQLGADAFKTPERVYQLALQAIERFELDDASFHPYSSRFDAYLDGKARLSEQEERGLNLFNDPKGGNCASCHPSAQGADGSHPLFTTFQFEALGAPRNMEIRANANPDYFDQGLCGPVRSDQASNLQYCGMFKTPGLRNVASRQVFLHNGRFHNLKELLEFYVQRDTRAEHWYGRDAHGTVKFDDMPTSARQNVDVIDLPLTRHKGEKPVWDAQQIDDVLAFLRTLTDADINITP